MRPLDRQSQVPLYVQLLDELRREITTGKLRAGDLLPAETDMSEQYRISRYTLRQAVDQLVRDGWLARYRGRGTFVTRPRILEQPLGGFYSFAREAAQRGLRQQSDVLVREIAEPTDDERTHLNLAEGEEVFRLKRLRFLGDEPLLTELLRLPRQLGQVLLAADLSTDSVYDLLEAQAGLAITRAREMIRPVVLNREDAALLHVEPGAAAFAVDRFGYAGLQMVEWRESLIRGDRFVYTVELPQQAAGLGPAAAAPGGRQFVECRVGGDRACQPSIEVPGNSVVRSVHLAPGEAGRGRSTTAD